MAEVTYYFNTYSGQGWATDPASMVDGILTNFASTVQAGNVTRLGTTNCPGTDLGTITKVEVRVYGYGDGNDRIDLAFNNLMNPPEYQLTMPATEGWSTYADVTADPFAGPWTWAKVKEVLLGDELRIEYDKVSKGNRMYCSKVEIKVSYTPVGAPSESGMEAQVI